MLNKVMIIGRLGADPELRYSQNGMPMTTLNVATDESYTGKDGTRQERTEWHRVVVFQRQAENCSNYLHKGSLVYVEGSLQTRKWQDQQGQDRYTTEIRAQRVQFLDRKGEGRPAGQEGDWNSAPRGQSQGAKQPAHGRRQGFDQRDDDDLGPAFPSEAGMNSGNNGPNLDEVPF